MPQASPNKLSSTCVCSDEPSMVIRSVLISLLQRQKGVKQSAHDAAWRTVTRCTAPIYSIAADAALLPTGGS